MNQNITDLLARFEVSDIEWLEQRARDQEEYERKKHIFAQTILPKLSKATNQHYKRWLKGFLDNGGKPTHFYDYKLPSNFYIANEDVKMIALCGASSIDIIAMPGIKITGELGHCSVFAMDNFTTQGICIPVYSDTIV